MRSVFTLITIYHFPQVAKILVNSFVSLALVAHWAFFSNRRMAHVRAIETDDVHSLP